MVFYFVSQSRYEGVAIPAGLNKGDNSPWPPAEAPAAAVPNEATSEDPQDVLQPETPPSPPDEQGGAGAAVENDPNAVKQPDTVHIDTDKADGEIKAPPPLSSNDQGVSIAPAAGDANQFPLGVMPD